MDLTAEFAELRSFLHSTHPDEKTRYELFLMLQTAHKQDETIYLNEWWPYVQGFDEWINTPLCHIYLEGISDGAFMSDLHRTSEELAHYRKIIPTGPIFLRVGGPDSYNQIPKPKRWRYKNEHREKIHKDIIGLCIDKPRWSYDGGQDGYGEGHANIEHVLDGVLTSFDGVLGTVQCFILKTSKHTEFELMIADEGHSNHNPGNIARLTNASKTRQLMEAFDNLRTLQLSLDWYPAELQTFTKMACWTQLEQLDLSHNKLGKTCIKKIFPESMDNLLILNLSNSPKFKDGGALALAKSKNLPKLKHLDLRHCDVTEVGVEALRQSSNLPHLETILT